MQTKIATAPYRIHRYPTEWIETWRLRNGQRATLRPVLPQDGEPERHFVAALSPASRRNRFHGTITGLSDRSVETMTCIDYHDHMGFVVTLVEGAGDDAHEIVIADARYVLDDSGDCAEFAVVVADAWHGLGLGKRLITALCQCAHRAGARWLCGEVLAGNRDMLALVARCGFHVKPHDEDDGVLRIERGLAWRGGKSADADSRFGALTHALPRWLHARRTASRAAAVQRVAARTPSTPARQ